MENQLISKEKEREFLFETFKKYAPEFRPRRDTPIGVSDYMIEDLDLRTVNAMTILDGSSTYNYKAISDNHIILEDNMVHRLNNSNYSETKVRGIIDSLYEKVLKSDLNSMVFGLIKLKGEIRRIPVNIRTITNNPLEWTLFRSLNLRNYPMTIPLEDIEFIDMIVVSNMSTFKREALNIEAAAKCMAPTTNENFDENLV